MRETAFGDSTTISRCRGCPGWPYRRTPGGWWRPLARSTSRDHRHPHHCHRSTHPRAAVRRATHPRTAIRTVRVPMPPERLHQQRPAHIHTAELRGL